MKRSESAFHIRKADAVKRIIHIAIGIRLLGACLLLAAALAAVGCAASTAPRIDTPPAPLVPIRYTIQAGAFAVVENAARLSDRLERKGLEAYYFADEDGLFKVRFGEFPTRASAQRRAVALQDAGAIDAYYIVGPGDFRTPSTATALRRRIVETARGQIGVPYRWGGDSAEEGFDCSGLSMTVYRLNGLNLPRSSRRQYRAGSPVSRTRLRPADLVFFATSGTGRVSHVGIYAGGGRFIHAPKTGGAVRTDSMENTYFKSRFVGARSYLR